MSDLSGIQKRKYYRLRYPKRARAVLRVQDELFHVSEVSERGIRILTRRVEDFCRGVHLSGFLDMNDESQIRIEGAILRHDDEEVILQLTKGPSFKNMVAEQRHIKNKYPSYFSKLREQMAQAEVNFA